MSSDTQQANELLKYFFLKEGSNPQFHSSPTDFTQNSILPLEIPKIPGTRVQHPSAKYVRLCLNY